METAHAISALLAIMMSASLHAASPQTAEGNAENVDTHKVDVGDAIACRLDAPTYNGFALSVAGDDGIANERHWTAIKSDNPFLSEYDLPAPIVVAGRYSTRRIAFTSTGIVAILDMSDPAIVARDEHIENAMNADPMIDAIVAAGKATRAHVEADIKFRKFLGERVISEVTEPVAAQNWRAHTVITRNVSNVTTHPGKTLYGCSYKIELLDKDGKPL